MKISIIIVSHSQAGHLQQCLDSIRRFAGDIPHETYVVDNASTDRSIDVVEKGFPDVTLIKNQENPGFGRANNQALSRAAGDFVLLLNNDARLTPGALEAMLAAMEKNTDTGIISCRLENPSGVAELSFGKMPGLKNDFVQKILQTGLFSGFIQRKLSEPAYPDWVSGAAMLIRSACLKACGHFDENFFMYLEDADLCVRARKHGWKVYYLPTASIKHARGESWKNSPASLRLAYRKSQIYFYRKHHGPGQIFLLKGFLLQKYFLRLAYCALRLPFTSHARKLALKEEMDLSLQIIRMTLRE